MKFTALVVEPYTNSTTANVVFADPETDPDAPSVLMFSRAVDIPDSAYYFEVNDQSYSSYGGLEKVRLTRSSIEIRLAAELVEEFGVADFTEVRADFDLDDETYQVVAETLQTIFAGEQILVVD